MRAEKQPHRRTVAWIIINGKRTEQSLPMPKKTFWP